MLTFVHSGYKVCSSYVTRRCTACLTCGQPFLAAGGILWTLSMLLCVFATQLWHFFVIMVGAARGVLLVLPILTSFLQGIIQGFANALVYPLIVRALPYAHHHSFSPSVVGRPSGAVVP